MTTKDFSTDMTSYAKGFAICALLWHHLFINRAGEFSYFVVKTANYGKVCIGIFVLLSGYGVSFSLLKSGVFDFYKDRISKLMFEFWSVFLLFVPVSIFVYATTLSSVYPNGHQWISLVFQFLGLQAYYGGAGFNSTWWFMSAILSFYLLAPALVYIVNRWPIFTLSCAFIILLSPQWFRGFLWIWFFPFMLGIWCQQKNVFVRLDRLLCSKGRGVCYIIEILCLAGFLFLRGRSPVLSLRNTSIDGFIAFWFISLLFSSRFHIRFFSRYMEFLGKHSLNIFLFHTFLLHWFHRVLYQLNNPILIFIALLGFCLLVSIALEKLKQILGIPKMIKRIRCHSFGGPVIKQLP